MILQSDLLDILFENRNKEYGAYALRRQYENRLTKSLVIIFSIFFLSIGLALLKNHFFPQSIKPMIIIDLPVPELPRLNDPKPKIKLMEKPAPQRIVMQRVFTRPLITRVEHVNPPPNLDELSHAAISNKPGNGNEMMPGDFLPAGQGSGSSGREEPAVESAGTSPLGIAEFMPEFPGGIKALQRFLSHNLKPPADGMEPGTVVRVLVRFVVDRDGSITGIEFEQSGGRNFDNEVLRVMKKMPLWKPGMQNGRTVPVYFKIPVIFQSEAEN